MEISARTGEGIKTLVQKAAQMVQAKVPAEPIHTFAGPVEHALAHIEEATQGALPQSQSRWYSIKLFERDANVLDALKLSPELISHIEDDIISVEKEMDDDAESIITNERYNYVSKVIEKCFVKKDKHRLTVSDKIRPHCHKPFPGTPHFCRHHVPCLLYQCHDHRNRSNGLGQ